jgi:hypothetical protein
MASNAIFIIGLAAETTLTGGGSRFPPFIAQLFVLLKIFTHLCLPQRPETARTGQTPACQADTLRRTIQQANAAGQFVSGRA